MSRSYLSRNNSGTRGMNALLATLLPSVTTAAPINAVASSLTTSLAGANNDMVFTAVRKGVVGDDITIAYVNPGTASAALSVGVVGKAITVNLATDSGTAQVETAVAVGTITAGVAQVETAVAVGTITTSGDATVTVTSALVVGSPLAVTVAVLENDTAADWAAKVRTALDATAAITDHYTVGGADANITLTALVEAANDATLNIALADDTSVGITEDATSDDTTAGVAPGTGNASVVVTGAGISGSPIGLNVAVAAGDTAADWAEKVRTALAANAPIISLYTVGGAGANITLTANSPAANDATLNIALDNGTCTGITTDATSDNTTAGAAIAITSTAALIKAAIEASDAASALVTLANSGGDTGAGVVTALAATPLASGVDGTPGEPWEQLWYSGALYINATDGTNGTTTDTWYSQSFTLVS